MTKHLALKEILEHLTSYRFFILTGLLSVVMALSVIVLYGDYRLRLENYAILRQGANATDIIIPPEPLSILVKGLDANLGRLYEVSVTGIQVHSSQQSINSLFSLFTVPDMLFIIKVLLAMIAVLMTFDAVSAEKEEGTLRLVLASGGQRLALLAGKLLGRFFLVYVPFLFLFAAASVVVSCLPDVQTGADYWVRIAAIGMVAGIYTLVFASAGVAVSSLTYRSATSLVGCMGVWVLVVFVVPNLGVTVAKVLSDVPAGDRVEMESRLASIQAIFERIQKEKGPQTGGEDQGRAMVAKIKEANLQIMSGYRPKLNQLVRTTRDILLSSPTGALVFLLTDAASTGVLEESRLKDAIAIHTGANLEKILASEEGKGAPLFSYRRSTLREALDAGAGLDLLILVLFGAAFAGVGAVRFLRYDVR